jgi:hypothetical protein
VVAWTTLEGPVRRTGGQLFANSCGLEHLNDPLTCRFRADQTLKRNVDGVFDLVRPMVKTGH